MFYRAFYVSYLLKVWVFVHVPSISPPIAAAPHQLRHYFVTYRNLHTSGPYSAAFLGQREPQQLQTEGLRGMSDARCGGRSDCKSCLAKSGGCSWCTYTDSTGAAAATCLFEDTANLCEDIRTVCPVAVESESSVAPIETVVGGAVGVAVGSCGLVFLFLYIMVRTFQQRPRMRLCSHTHIHTHTVCADIPREVPSSPPPRPEPRPGYGSARPRGCTGVGGCLRERSGAPRAAEPGWCCRVIAAEATGDGAALPPHFGVWCAGAGGRWCVGAGGQTGKKGAGRRANRRRQRRAEQRAGRGDVLDLPERLRGGQDVLDATVRPRLPPRVHHVLATLRQDGGRRMPTLQGAERASEPHPLPLPAPTPSPGPTVNERVRLG